MAFRIEKAALGLALALVPAIAAEFPARHDHTRKFCSGTLTLDDNGVSYRETDGKNRKHPHAWTWAFADIRQLELAPKRIRILTYEDSVLRLGAPREINFNGDFAGAYPLMKDRLDQRFVAVMPDPEVKPLWELPVKRLGRFGGPQGVLLVGEDRIVFRPAAKSEARTWRLKDIDNISTSGPFELTLTTFERSSMHYGSRKDFNFQLKQPLDERRYNDLWRKLHQ